MLTLLWTIFAFNPLHVCMEIPIGLVRTEFIERVLWVNDAGFYIDEEYDISSMRMTKRNGYLCAHVNKDSTIHSISV